jgi:hypothetical protein
MSNTVVKPALALAAAALVPFVALASSHREAPAITAMPKVDATDVFAFMSYEPGREGYVTLIANYYPFQDPFAGPNYFSLDETAQYTIRIDNDGDAREDISLIFDFNNELGGEGERGIRVPVGSKRVPVPLKNVGPVKADDLSMLNWKETYTLNVRRRSGRSGFARSTDGTRVFTKPFDYAGTKTFGDAAAYDTYARQYIYEVQVPGCEQTGRLFVGQRDEPFQIAVGKIFDLVNLVPVEEGAVPNLAGIAQSPENDTLANKNITSLALEVHADCLKGSGNGVIGVWTTATQTEGEGEDMRFTQVSRLGMPLVNEVVVGLPSKDTFNRSRPRDDAAFLDFVTNPTLPVILDTLFRDAVNAALPNDVASLAPANLPRNDLVAAFLTGFKGVNQLARVTPSEMQRLNTALPATPADQQSALGVLGGDLAGFPNGRRPGDDVTDIELRVAMGRLCHPLTINGTETNLGFCTPEDAPVGTAPFTDGAPTSAADFDTRFPYLRTPIPGSADFPALASSAGSGPQG